MAADSGASASNNTPVADAPPADDAMLGRRVGAYKAIRRIGQGGMGVVYEASHDKMQQRAAIKFLHPEFSQDDKILQRFFNEARAISMARHSSIVTIYDFGQLDDGTAFILMEFLEGESLLTRMERMRHQQKTLDLYTVVELSRQVAEALAVIHSKNIIHRDLKPENIFVVPDSVAPLGERVKLLDFGIAKFLEGPVRKTTVGMILGTPLYMSPEQCEGAEDLDARVDVYSLGIMLFEMVTGQLPFIADTAAALMRQHMFKDAPRLRDEVKTVPAELDTLVHQMLAKRADGRPTMEEVADVLDGLLPVVAPPGLSITGARRNKSARMRPSQPDSHVADPFAATIGGAHGPTPPGKPAGPAAGLGTTPVSSPPLASSASLDPLSTTGIAPGSPGSGPHPVRSTTSQSGLLPGSSARFYLPQSDGSRTDTVVAIGRRPVNLVIAVALLLLLAVLSWGTLSKKRGPDLPVDKTVVPVPVSTPPLLTPKPAENVEPAPAPLGKAPVGVDTQPHSDNKHHPKHHKKAGEGGKSEETPVSVDDNAGKKAKAGKADAAEKAWDVDARSAP